MTEQIFELLNRLLDLLNERPTLSISLGFLFAIFLGYTLKAQIRNWVKKKYNLYDEKEITKALEKASDERLFYQKTTEKLTATVTERVLKFLKRKND